VIGREVKFVLSTNHESVNNVDKVDKVHSFTCFVISNLAISFNFGPYIEDDGTTAQWLCHRGMCEWTGGSSLEGRKGGDRGGAGGDRKAGKKEGGKNSRPGSGSSVGMGTRQGSGAGGAVKFPPPEALELIGTGQLTAAAAKWAVGPGRCCISTPRPRMPI